jgi:peroxiredoxin
MRIGRSLTGIGAALLAASFLAIAGVGPQPGSLAPDFGLKSPQGATTRLSSLRGRIVVLHFWATWCPHCVEEMPLLAQLARENDPRRVTVLAVNLGEPARKVSRYLRSRQLSLAVLLDARGKVARAYGVAGLPSTVIVDASGRIVREISMGSLDREEFRRTLKPLLEE